MDEVTDPFVKKMQEGLRPDEREVEIERLEHDLAMVKNNRDGMQKRIASLETELAEYNYALESACEMIEQTSKGLGICGDSNSGLVRSDDDCNGHCEAHLKAHLLLNADENLKPRPTTPDA